MSSQQAPWYKRRAGLLLFGGLVLGVGAILAGVYGSKAANANKKSSSSKASAVQTQSANDPYSSLVRANPLTPPAQAPRPVVVSDNSASPVGTGAGVVDGGDKAVAPSGGQKSWFETVMGNLGFGDAGDKAVQSAADAWKVGSWVAKR
jgi:hypothetical protein